MTVGLLGVLPGNVACVLARLSDDEYQNYDIAKRALFRRIGIPFESDREAQSDGQKVHSPEETGQQVTVEIAVEDAPVREEHEKCEMAEPSEPEREKSEAVAGTKLGAIPESVPCEDEACPSGHEKIKEALETFLIPGHMGNFPESSRINRDTVAAEPRKDPKQQNGAEIAQDSSFGHCAMQAYTETGSAANLESPPCGDEACSSITIRVCAGLDTFLVPQHLS